MTKVNRMKILYAIQGTGNGHLARATDIVPLLREIGETDVLVSGIQGDIQLPFKIDYKLYGMSFIFGQNGGVSISGTLKKLKLFRFLHDIIMLPVKKYDLVLCDFEPVTAWACRLRGKKCIGLSHQNAVLHAKSPRPEKTDLMGQFILKHYAPATTKYGFHFKALDEQNFTPVIRSAIRNAVPKNNGHYTVYLPAYSNEEIEGALSAYPHINWEVFSKHSKKNYQSGNIHFKPVSLEGFSQSFINCKGILCTAGFETPAEAIFMGKKLCVVPMKNQYEQACNAAFLQSMGITVLDELKNQEAKLEKWLNDASSLQIAYPNITKKVLKQILAAQDATEGELFLPPIK